jgi:prepilin-type N-terminal cleavage/methylation domain-containing protein
MKNYHSLFYREGFTVLEFLVVIAMIGIIIAIAFASLSLSRSRSRDDQRIARLESVSVALEDFYRDCREYPLFLSSSYPCGNTGQTLGSYMVDIDSTIFNQTGSEFHYIPLSFAGPDGSGHGCTGYHLGVQLENNNNSFSQKDANFNSSTPGPEVIYCDSSNLYPQPVTIVNGFNGTDPGLYDIKH